MNIDLTLEKLKQITLEKPQAVLDFEATVIAETTEEKLLTENGEVVLIVDDEYLIAKIMQIGLEEHNYQTMVASNALDAIALYTQHSKEISVILMDIVMPLSSINGLNAIQTLKKINPDIRIIANSGLPEHRQSALELGADAFMIKPYTIQQLLNILASLRC